jgi:DNA-formamidopyrimidine glycosylase
MPEGPEVLHVTTQLNQVVQNKTLVEILPLSGRYTKTPITGLNYFKPELVKSVQCHGKFIWWTLENQWIFSTLGMTGSYKTEPNNYARIRFNFSDGSSIFYCDMRNFGTLRLVYSKQELTKKLQELGPDMLSNPPNLDKWLEICKKHQTKTLVSFLMEQKAIAGVGNIYKSESLFLARLDPRRKLSTCTQEELERLYDSIKQVLRNSYDLGGATIRNYSDLYSNHGAYIQFPSQPSEMMKARIGVMVYSKKEDPYGNPVERLQLNDKRTTWWSPSIQR